MKPTNSKILVQVVKQESVDPSSTGTLTASGSSSTATPLTAVNPSGPWTGLVLEVGPQVRGIKVTDIVVFSPYGFDEVMVGQEKMIIIDESLILATNNAKSISKAKG